MLPKDADYFILFVKQNVFLLICETLLQFKTNVFKNVLYSFDGIAAFLAAVTPVFSVTLSFRNVSNAA